MTEDTEKLDTRDVEQIRALMGRVVDKSSKREGACAYRGEPECYEIVSSGLYRKCSEGSKEDFDIQCVEKEIIADARSYTTMTEEVEILTEIQHYGGATNLIDFTSDYLVAVFFACAGHPDRNGRVVLHWPDKDTLVKPKQTNNRIITQKSIFIQPRRGFILPNARDETIVVPAYLKEKILQYLERYHDISRRTVYNDIHGFIRHQDPTQGDYTRGLRASNATQGPTKTIDLERMLQGRRIYQVNMTTRYHADHPRGIVYEEYAGSLLLIDADGEPGSGSPE